MKLCLLASLLTFASVLPAAELGAVKGSLGYPSEDVPVTRVCAISVSSPRVFRCVVTKFNQRSYEVRGLAVGSYYVVAYPKPPASWGIKEAEVFAYTRAVKCGMRVGCNDHSLIPVSIRGGQTVGGIAPTDGGDPNVETHFPEEPPT